ncbi:MAG: carbohydrate kinase family protein [Chloroflexota bacterium]
MNIVITGSIAYDYLMSFPGKFTDMLLADQLHNISVSFLVDSLKRQRGGTAPNIAYTLALLGANPTVMATAGQDFGDYRVWLEKYGVDTSAIIEIEEEYCASFFVNTDEEQNQIASFYTGAMAHAKELSFATHAPKAGLATISPNDPVAMRAYAAECKRLNIPYIYDPSQQIARLSGEELRDGLDGCFLLTVNEYEYGVIREKTGLSEDDILARVGGLLVTLGADGSTLIVNGETTNIPIVKADRIVDPTGAGDAFRAGLMRGMQLDLPWDIAGRMGALSATYVLENLGTQNHYFTPAQFVARYRENFDDNGRLDVFIG